MPPISSVAQQRPPTLEQPESTPTPIIPKISFTGAPLPPADTPIPCEETTIFIDWDDTCLASNHLKNSGFSTRFNPFPLQKEFVEMGEVLSMIVGPLLLEAAQLGRVVIVTNGTEGWVQESCSWFMPTLIPLISQLTVVSAQERYGRMFPSKPIEWKRRTFRDVLDAETRPLGRIRNLISIGDGLAEQMAAHAMRAYPDTLFNNPVNVVKVIKLLEFPSLENLVQQQLALHDMLKAVVNHPTSLDMTARLSYVSSLPPLPDSDSESEAPEFPPGLFPTHEDMEKETREFFIALTEG